MTSNEIRIACAARRDYLPHAAAMLDSALENCAPGAEVRFLHGDDIPSRQRDRLAAMVAERGGTLEAHLIEPDRVAGLKTIDFLPASHWYRTLLPDLLPDTDRVLYLDADVIVVDSLEPLWRIELGEHAFGAVTNVFQHDHVIHPERLGMVHPETYFNSGVMLLDLDALRGLDAASRLTDYARENHAVLGFPEQDAMNVVFGDRRLPLHPRWNVMNSILNFDSAVDVFGAQALAEARESPAIRHFEGPGPNKPWHLLCDRPDRELYARHRAQTPWPRMRTDGISPSNLVEWARRRRAR